MRVVTGQFGEVEFSEDSVIYFPKGTIGFEECRQFLVVEDEAYTPFKGLMSVDARQVSFPVLDPFMIDAEFGKMLPPALTERLCSSDNKMDVFCIVNLNGENNKVTINLKSPIVIDYQQKRGEQIVLDSDDLPVALPIL